MEKIEAPMAWLLGPKVGWKSRIQGKPTTANPENLRISRPSAVKLFEFRTERSNGDALVETWGDLDRKLESWKVGSMKTTLDLPGDLVREMKLRAAQEGRKLRDVATEIFRRGLSQPTPSGDAVRHRVKLPLIACRTPVAPAVELTADQVADVLLKQEVEWSRETAGP